MHNVAGRAAGFRANKDEAFQTLVDNGSSLNMQGDICRVLQAALCSPAVK